MKKKLYVRFFRHQEDSTPIDSQFVCTSDDTGPKQMKAIAETSENISLSLLMNPNGKVDFVWLS